MCCFHPLQHRGSALRIGHDRRGKFATGRGFGTLLDRLRKVLLEGGKCVQGNGYRNRFGRLSLDMKGFAPLAAQE